MACYKFLIVEEEGLKVLNVSVWAMIQKYKRHGTISCLPGSVRLTTDRLCVTQFTCHLVMYAYVLVIA